MTICFLPGWLWVPVLAVCFAPQRAPRPAAAVLLDGHFQPHMVLQRERPLTITGVAPGSSWVEVGWDDIRTRAPVEEGRFSAVLPPLAHGGPHALWAQTDEGVRIELPDVLVGDVWLVSGQSNAAMVLGASEGGQEAAAQATDLVRVRGLTVASRLADEPHTEIGGTWSRPSPETALQFSALGFHLARELALTSDVPQGVIVAAQGDSTGEAWVSKAVLLADPELEHIVHAYERLVLDHDRVMADFRAALERFHEQNRLRSRQGFEPSRRPPRAPLGPDNIKRPWGLREGMIAPLFRLPVRGVVWYQGESNAPRAKEYQHILRALIADWRAGFGDPTLPFLVVQPPGLGELGARTSPGHWARLREAQRRVFAEVPHVGLAIALDLGDPDDVHSPRKRELGERVALLARRVQQGAAPGASGPVPVRFEAEAGAMRVTLACVEGGGLVPRGPLDNFELQDAQGTWWPAHAQIERVDTALGGTVIVRHPAVHAVAVRYAWLDHPASPLVDGAGRVASPFSSADEALKVGG